MLYTHILRHSISWRYPRKVLENAWYAMRSTPKAPTPFKLRLKNTFVKLDTNATLLNRNNGLKMLKASPNILSISIDGMKKETYEKIRVGANFEKVIENTENFVKLKKEVGNTVTKIHTFMVVQQENLMQLPEYIKWADKIGVDSINGTFVIRLGMNENTDLGLNKSKA